MNRFTAKFAALQGFYWISACLVYSFSERFLTAYGLPVQRVGLVMACASVAALLLQPLFADLADRENGPSQRSEILALCGAAIALTLPLLLGTLSRLWVAVLFGGMAAVTLTVQPLANAVGFFYVDRGAPIDYSLGRGIASAVFALACYLMGLLAQHGEHGLLLCYLFANVGLLLMAIWFAPPKYKKTAAAPSAGTLTLLKKHAFLPRFLLGMLLVFTAHNFINTYMLSIVSMIGRGTREMSIAISLAAILEIPTMAGFSALQKRFSLRSLLLFALGMFLVKHALLLLPLYAGTGVWSVYLSQAFQMLGYALFIPASSFYINERMDETDKVKGQMLLTEAITFGTILGQLTGGAGIAAFGVPMTMLLFCAVTAVGIVLCAGALFQKESPQPAV